MFRRRINVYSFVSVLTFNVRENDDSCMKLVYLTIICAFILVFYSPACSKCLIHIPCDYLLGLD